MQTEVWFYHNLGLCSPLIILIRAAHNSLMITLNIFLFLQQFFPLIIYNLIEGMRENYPLGQKITKKKKIKHEGKLQKWPLGAVFDLKKNTHLYLAGAYIFWSVSSSHFKGFLIRVCADKSEAKNNYII